jgi:predicted Zn-dependent peptidase
VTVDEVLEAADKYLKKSEDWDIETVMPEEPENVVCAGKLHCQPVGLPLFCFGYKMRPLCGTERLKAEIMTEIIADILTDSASDFYKRMSDKNLLNSSFDCEVFTGDGYFALIFSGESSDPGKLFEELNRTIEDIKKSGLDRKYFDILRKDNYGSAIRRFNNVHSVAEMLLNDYFSGNEVFDGLDVLRNLTYEETQEFFEKNIITANSAVSVVKTS